MTSRTRIPTRRGVVIGSTVLAAGLVSGGIAYAANSPQGGSTSSYGDGYGRGGGPEGGFPGGRGHRGPLGVGGWAGGPGALHGTVVRGTNAAGTSTEADVFQTGTVTSVSATSLAVKSTDGFTATYVLNSSTREGQGPREYRGWNGSGESDGSNSATAAPISAAPTVGEKVVVVAVLGGDGTKTATEVHEAGGIRPTRPSGTPSATPSPGSSVSGLGGTES